MPINPFAIITAAHLLTRQTRKDHEERYRWKQKVVRLLYEKGWDKQEVIDLFAIIDWMMHLPQHLTRKFRTELDNYEQVTKMRYITSVERLAMEEGKQEGEKEGVKKGKLEGKAASLEKLITLKFGECSEEVKQQLHKADEAQLDAGLERILTASSLDEVLA